MVRVVPRPPQLSDEARQAALVKAAEARRARAEIKQRPKMGSLSLPQLLDQAVSDRQTQPFVLVLRTDERLEEPRAHRLGNARSIVADDQLHSHVSLIE